MEELLLITQIKSLFQESAKENGANPTHARVIILFNGEEKQEEVVIKLSLTIGDDDEQIFYNCNDLTELTELCQADSGADFRVLNILEFY